MRIPLLILAAGLLLAPAGFPAVAAAAETVLTNVPSTIAFSNTLTNASSKTQARPLLVEHADNLEYFRMEEFDEDIIRLTGSIVLKYGGVSLAADRVSVNMKTRLVYGWGRVNILERGSVLQGEGFFYDLRRERGVVYRGASVIDGILYRGEEIKTLDKDSYRITDARFSTCDYERPHFDVLAKRLWIYPDRSFLVLHLVYRTGGVPIFYFPFAFRTKKGTGIDSFAGYNSAKGYFLQNSYDFDIGRLAKADLMADYYQFLGPYAGLRLASRLKNSETEILLNYGLRRPSLTDTNVAWTSRWLISGREDLTLSSKKLGTSRLSGYYFDASDNLFSSEYILQRNTKTGIGLLGLDRFQQSRRSVYVNQNNRYANWDHKLGGLSLAARTRWDLSWNDARSRYVTTRSVLPGLSARYSGRLVSFRTVSNAGFGGKLLDLMVNRINWSASAAFNNTEYFDFSKGSYLKTERSSDVMLGLSKEFNFFNVFRYAPSLSLGDIRRSGQGLSADELGNFRQESFSYLTWSESWRLNFVGFLRKPAVTAGVGAVRNFKSEILAPKDRLESDYGNVRAHSLSLSGALGYSSTPLLPSFRWDVSTSADLKTPVGVKFDLLQPDRFGPLLQKLSFAWGKTVSVSLQDSWIYSLKDGRSTRNTATARLTAGPFSGNLGWIENFDNPRQNNMTAGYAVSFAPFKTLKLSVGVNSRNENLFAYDKSLVRKYGLPASFRRNLLTDLADSFDFFDVSKRKKSYFKVQSVSVSFSHDLHCWEMNGGYSLRQSYISVPSLRYARFPYWEHSFWVQINLKEFTSVRYRKEQTTEAPRVD